MAHKLVLEIPEEVYQPLTTSAKRTGATPEAVAVEWLSAISRHAVRDPVEGFIGAFRSNIPDWADQHDKYLGELLKEQLDGASGAGA